MLWLAPLQNPIVSIGGATVLLLAAAAALIMVMGDPRAGAPRVRAPISHSAALTDAVADPATGPDAGSVRPATDAPPTALPEGATIIHIGGDGTLTGGHGAALAAAPLAGLTQPGPGGLLPVIGPDGRTPAQAYARPYQDTGKPKVALVIGGLGLNPTATRQAIDNLPPQVTLSFVPYADGLQGWIDQARAAGHEVLLETPMEPMDFPDNDPGPYTLMAKDPPQETIRRLDWLMSRATGYFGMTNYLGGRFLASDRAMGVFLGDLRQRGLAFIDDGSAAKRPGGGAPRASANRIVDDQLDGDAIGKQLQGLEASARRDGSALGSGFAYPVTLQQVQQWAAGLEQRGLSLAPASAVMHR